jgi:hypothetical protein
MKTPCEAFKENFWVGAKGGLVDKKHYLKMRDAVWLFLYLLREQTGLNQFGEGVVNYGHPRTFQEIGDEMKGISAETIRVWAATLRRARYIRTESHGHRGLVFWIAKAKAKTRKVKITHEEARFMLESARNLRHSPRGNPNGQEISPREDLNGESILPREESNGEREPKTPQVFMGQFVAQVSDSPTPKGFTSENLSYYNKDSHAQSACSPTLPLEKLIRRRDVPREPTARQLDERRRELLRQAEEMAHKYPLHRQTGQVIAIQKAASA